MVAPSVLFVCTGNTCRSPIAAAIFRARLASLVNDAPHWKIESAGIRARENDSASQDAQMVLADLGFDLSAHRARQVNRALISQYDLILTMEADHKAALQVEYPEAAGRVFLLSEMHGGSQPVLDPYGSGLDVYEQTAQQIETMLERGAQRIIDRARDGGALRG